MILFYLLSISSFFIAALTAVPALLELGKTLLPSSSTPAVQPEAQVVQSQPQSQPIPVVVAKAETSPNPPVDIPITTPSEQPAQVTNEPVQQKEIAQNPPIAAFG